MLCVITGESPKPCELSGQANRSETPTLPPVGPGLQLTQQQEAITSDLLNRGSLQVRPFH